MSRTITDLRDSVSAILSGVDLNSIDGVNVAFERAARVFVQKAKIPETQVKQNITLYDGVTDYAVNAGIFGTSIVDIRPQGISRQRNDFVFKKFQDDFDREKNFIYSGTMATFDYLNGDPIIRIATTLTKQKILLDTMNDDADWTAGGNASSLTDDETNYYQSPASLKFNLATSGSQGTLTKTISQVDLTDYLGVGVAFLAVYLPTGSVFTSIGAKIGSDASNYYSVSNTENTLGSFVSGEWQLIKLDLASATTTGSPDIANIDYTQVYLNYDGTSQINVRCGYLFISLPTPFQILYSTAGLFKVGSTVSNSITADTDTIILNDAAYTIYEYECALQILQQTGGSVNDSMTLRIDNILNDPVKGLYPNYRAENPSEILRSSGSYYEPETPWGGQF